MKTLVTVIFALPFVCGIIPAVAIYGLSAEAIIAAILITIFSAICFFVILAWILIVSTIIHLCKILITPKAQNQH